VAAPEVKQALSEPYGSAIAAQVDAVEAFEVSEYGRQSTREELQRLFPFAAKPVRK